MINVPNIILFMVDQLSAKWLEAASQGVCPTPSLDRLRARGTTFTRAITSNPLCCPARATLATGQTTRGHGVLQNGYVLDPALPTFMRVLQQNGWRTGAFGKLHFRPHFMGVHPDYRPYGFDVVHNTEDARAGEWLDWIEAAHPEYYNAALATIWAGGVPELQCYGANGVNLRARIEKVRRDFDWATPQSPESDWRFHTLPFPEEISQTAWIARHALDFIQCENQEQPIFAHISYVQPHSPFCPPAEYMECVDTQRIPEPAPAEWWNDPLAPPVFRQTHSDDSANWRTRRQYYFADIAHLDSKLGRVLDALEQSDRLDKAYIIFLSDHGELLGDHGFQGKHERHYDACIRVPLIVSGPGVRVGQTCDALVQLEDICPTVLDMAAQSYPAYPVAGYLREDVSPPVLPGRSLLPLCRGEQPEYWRAAAYCESYNSINSSEPESWARTLYTNEFRYTFYPDGSGEQLFNLRDDCDEQRNLAGEAACAGVRQKLRDQLMEVITLQDYPPPRRGLFALGVH
jgi:arylsulfatase A-like enzyme